MNHHEQLLGRERFLRMLALLMLLLAFLALGGCNRIESRKVGVRFWKLPTYLGGGLSNRVFRSGELAIHYPIISELYAIDIGLRDLEFSVGNQAALKTRALDGNELILEVTVTFQLKQDRDKLIRLIQEVGKTPEEIEAIVRSIARADIRTYMNELRTSEFIDSASSYGALDKVREKLQERLGPYGFEFKQLKLDRYRFDDEYENLLKKIQQLEEDVKRERERRLVIEREIERDKEKALGLKNALLREAAGYREKRIQDGENYLREKKNQAQAMRSAADAEATALQKQIEAFSGPGGDALVRLELAKRLLENKPRFVILSGSKNGGDINVNRMDANKLLEQAQVFEALREDVTSSPIGRKEVQGPIASGKGVSQEARSTEP
ncbi:MAG: SPFH domain-containing protein [Bdellovibrionota bacterium]|jgi:uncharacterized membrane protein YqiK